MITCSPCSLLYSIKIAGKLPQVQVNISDQRIVEISQLVLSIALPETPTDDDETDSDSDYQVRVHSVLSHAMRGCSTVTNFEARSELFTRKDNAPF